MEVPGFNLLLQDFCEYCPEFEPEIEKINCMSLDDGCRFFTNIRCANRKKCACMAKHIERRVQHE